MKQDSAIRKTIAIFLLICLLLGTVGCMNPPEQTDTTSPEDSTRLPETTIAPETIATPETTGAPETTEAPTIYTHLYTPKTVEGETDTLVLLQTIFTEQYFGTRELIILDTYEELLAAYAHFKNDQPISCQRQNVTEAEATGAYPPEYFETGYLIALCDYSLIYNPGIECEVEKRGDVIVVNEHYCTPFKRAEARSTIFYLLPLEGAYAGETVEFNRIKTSEPPRY